MPCVIAGVGETTSYSTATLFYFRGALLPDYQRAVDELFVHAECQVADITMAEHMPRNEALLLAMMVGVNRDLRSSWQRLPELEEQYLNQPLR